MRKFKFTITFKDGTYVDTIADRWVGRGNWIVFLLVNDQGEVYEEKETLRVVTSEIRMIERRKP